MGKFKKIKSRKYKTKRLLKVWEEMKTLIEFIYSINKKLESKD